jgi:hypothetical protein
MDEHRLIRIEAKIDDQNSHLASIDTTLMAQHVSLRDHVRRTALLEAELKPIKRHVNMVDGAIKLVILLAAVAAIVEAAHLVMK